MKENKVLNRSQHYTLREIIKNKFTDLHSHPSLSNYIKVGLLKAITFGEGKNKKGYVVKGSDIVTFNRKMRNLAELRKIARKKRVTLTDLVKYCNKNKIDIEEEVKEKDLDKFLDKI
jgi:hypothetical protein